MRNICHVCTKKKSKRKCPLFSSICSSCCGQERSKGACPESCKYFIKGQRFAASKDIETTLKKAIPKIEYFKKNKSRLHGLISEVEQSILDVTSRDFYYHDKIILEGIRRAQKYFSDKSNSSESEEVLLNRVGVIELLIKEAIVKFKFEVSDLTSMDIDSTIEWEIFTVNSYLMNGTGAGYLDKLKEIYSNSEKQDQSIII